MKKTHKQLILCLLVVTVLGLQQLALVNAIPDRPPRPPPITTTYRIYGTAKQSGTNLAISGATVYFYGNGVSYIGSTTTDSNGNFNYYKSLSTRYSYVKTIISKTGYQTTTKNTYNLDNTYPFGSVYLVKLKTQSIIGHVENDETSRSVSGVEVKIYAGNGGVTSYKSTVTTDSSGWFSTSLTSTGYDTVKVVLTKEGYYEKEAAETSLSSFYFGDIDMHAYQKIAVIFWASNPGLAEDDEIESVINGYKNVLSSEGYSKFFTFHNTENYAHDMSIVNDYERAKDIIFMYTFSHGKNGGLALDGVTNDADKYEVSGRLLVEQVELLDSERICVVVSACFGFELIKHAIGTDLLFITASNNSRSWEWYVMEDGIGLNIHYEQEVFAHYYFEGISLGKSAVDAFDYAYGILYDLQVNSALYISWQEPRIYNGLTDPTDADDFFGA